MDLPSLHDYYVGQRFQSIFTHIIVLLVKIEAFQRKQFVMNLNYYAAFMLGWSEIRQKSCTKNVYDVYYL